MSTKAGPVRNALKLAVLVALLTVLAYHESEGCVQAICSEFFMCSRKMYA